ncbi:hypothetical protein CAOG_05412 [Capsaspora owczarzaki ATCC 30864]|uniref:C3H1-type domain-containing protein n=1 Tax=Capsaspora owczarzaki (strain ATCC 30864) TaxID=595528 RepID=A0A0D2VU07_CAPO3|nr:hypothetical protein CAOG_05412 [Capsaspora owczarzaki ATCC 30864]KJE94842.1 hypothetical protein CAOG_005412 [Capsaspora owczarzaki ATCC 30864]|eukprot:XP_004346085.1 hypothetical protein CAOG_05412 [Capsaspora owczarzaki ATCC 30864]
MSNFPSSNNNSNNSGGRPFYALSEGAFPPSQPTHHHHHQQHRQHQYQHQYQQQHQQAQGQHGWGDDVSYATPPQRQPPQQPQYQHQHNWQQHQQHQQQQQQQRLDLLAAEFRNLPTSSSTPSSTIYAPTPSLSSLSSLSSMTPSSASTTPAGVASTGSPATSYATTANPGTPAAPIANTTATTATPSTSTSTTDYNDEAAYSYGDDYELDDYPDHSPNAIANANANTNANPVNANATATTAKPQVVGAVLSQAPPAASEQDFIPSIYRASGARLATAASEFGAARGGHGAHHPNEQTQQPQPQQTQPQQTQAPTTSSRLAALSAAAAGVPSTTATTLASSSLPPKNSMSEATLQHIYGFLLVRCVEQRFTVLQAVLNLIPTLHAAISKGLTSLRNMCITQIHDVDARNTILARSRLILEAIVVFILEECHEQDITDALDHNLGLLRSRISYPADINRFYQLRHYGNVALHRTASARGDADTPLVTIDRMLCDLTIVLIKTRRIIQHVASSQNTGPVLQPGQGYKRVLCRHFLRGACGFGSKCSFAHGTSDLVSRNGTHPNLPNHVAVHASAVTSEEDGRVVLDVMPGLPNRLELLSVFLKLMTQRNPSVFDAIVTEFQNIRTSMHHDQLRDPKARLFVLSHASSILSHVTNYILDFFRDTTQPRDAPISERCQRLREYLVDTSDVNRIFQFKEHMLLLPRVDLAALEASEHIDQHHHAVSVLDLDLMLCDLTKLFDLVMELLDCGDVTAYRAAKGLVSGRSRSALASNARGNMTPSSISRAAAQSRGVKLSARLANKASQLADP